MHYKQKNLQVVIKLLIASLFIIPLLIIIVVMIFLFSERDTEKKKYDDLIQQASKVEKYNNSLKDNISSVSSTTNSSKEQAKVNTPKDKYSSLTNSEKKAICNYIQGRYNYYDNINGGYAGDKYSDRIMQEAANKYGITSEQAFIIWSNMYSY